MQRCRPLLAACSLFALGLGLAGCREASAWSQQAAQWLARATAEWSGVSPGKETAEGRAAGAPSPAGDTDGDGGTGGKSAGSAQPAGSRPPSEEPPGTKVYYQFVDASGSLRFVDDPREIPAALREEARRVEIETRRPLGRAAGDAAERAPNPWASAAQAPWERRALPVVVYTAPWCGWCRKTLAYLDRKGVLYTNKDIEAQPAYREELFRKTGSVSIPVTEVGDQIIRGYDVSAFDRLW